MLPHDFKHIFQDRMYLESLVSGPYYRTVGEEGNLGRRMSFGPLCVEYYTGDNEPELSSFRGFRFVIWTPVTRSDIPKGWRALFKESSQAICAYMDIRDINTYYKKWSATFRTYHNRFPMQSRYRVEEVKYTTFSKQYQVYGRKSVAMRLVIDQMENLESLDARPTHYYFLVDTETATPVAGIAIVDCLSVRQSFYITAFTRKNIAPKEAGLWLIDFWMKKSSERGMFYANLGNIWTKGHPASWKGFSEFKMKFNPEFLILKRELVRCTFKIFV